MDKNRLAADLAQRVIVSPAGSFPLRFEARYDSPLPDRLMQLGFAVHHAGSGQRMLHDAIVETFREDSPGRPWRTRQHAGLVNVNVFAISLPRAKP